MGWVHSDGKRFREGGPDPDSPTGWVEVTDEEYREYEAQAFEVVRAAAIAEEKTKATAKHADACSVYAGAIKAKMSKDVALILARQVEPGFTDTNCVKDK